MPYIFLLSVLLCGLVPFASAQAADAASALSGGDSAWILVSTVLVTLMLLPGVILFYSGMIRKKNALSISVQTMTGGAILSILWVMCGYSLIFTPGTPFIGGLSKVMLQHVSVTSVLDSVPNIPEVLFCVFELSFAAITPVLVLGACAERMKFSTAMWFTPAWSLLIYMPIGHMTWGPGGLFGTMGAMDFAGGLVVHITSGFSSLVTALVVGRRKDDGITSLAPHNLILTLSGGCLLWVGWFGFNGGSALGANASAAMAILNTQIAACAALCSWLVVEWKMYGKPSVLGAISGAIAGLVAITPGCGFVTPAGALIIGALGGIACLWAVNWPKHRFHFDDALDVWAIHGVGGVLGAILTGVFAASSVAGEGKGGVLEGNWKQLLVQIEVTVFVAVFTIVMTLIILTILKKTVGLCASEKQQLIGLDLTEHGEALR